MLKLALRRIFKKRKNSILILLVFFILGAILILFNFWYYHSNTESFEIRYNQNTKNVLLIEKGNPAKISFNVRNLKKIDHVVIEFKFREVNSSLISFYVNEKLIENLRNLYPGSVYRASLDKNLLSQKNKLKLSSKGKVVLEFVKIKQYMFFQKALFLILNLVGFLIIFGPFLGWKYIEFLKREELEDRFPDFLRDVVEGLKAGMSLPQAVKSTDKIDYGKLSPYVQKISAQIEWGVPFEKTLVDFGKESHSKNITRAVNAIIQTYQSGGKISDILDSIGENLKEIKKLKKERQSELYGEVLTGYIVYVAFLVVLIGFMRYLLPALSLSGDILSLQTGGESAKAFIYSYRVLFRNLIIIQAIFSGLVIGKLSEGKLSSGIKHVAILLIIGYTTAVLLL